jgi:hypothetical protein
MLNPPGPKPVRKFAFIQEVRMAFRGQAAAIGLVVGFVMGLVADLVLR